MSEISSNQVNDQPAAEHQDKGKPWWKFPIVWMVISGPLIVVVAALTTVVVAVKHVDPVLNVDNTSNKGLMPAVQGRNHAAETSANEPAER